MKSVGSDKVIIVSNKIRKTTTSIRIITFARCSHIQVSCEYIVDECLEIPRKRRDKKRKQNYKKCCPLFIHSNLQLMELAYNTMNGS